MTAVPDSLQSVFDRAFAGLSRGREAFAPRLVPHEVGAITSVSTGIARVSGLPGVGFDELVSFPGDVFGIAFNVDEDEIADAISDLLKNKPYLGAQGGRRFQGTADGGARKDTSPTQLTEADLARMSPEEIVQAKTEGRFNKLLGIE